jgi:hypothetical protein
MVGHHHSQSNFPQVKKITTNPFTIHIYGKKAITNNIEPNRDMDQM